MRILNFFQNTVVYVITVKLNNVIAEIISHVNTNELKNLIAMII